MVRAIQGHACNSPFSSGRRRRELDYYSQGSLVAAVVALAIAGYLRVWAKDDAEARAFASLSFLIFLWCFPEYLWKTLDSAFWHRVSLAAVLFIPPFVLRYSGSAVRTRPRWYPIAFASGVWISAILAATIANDRLFFSPWWNVAALLYVYPYLGLSLHIVVRHGFRAKPSSIDRKKFQFLLVGGGIASLVAPLNFLPGTGIPFPPLPAARLVRDPSVLLLHGDGDPPSSLLRIPGHRGAGDHPRHPGVRLRRGVRRSGGRVRAEILVSPGGDLPHLVFPAHLLPRADEEARGDIVRPPDPGVADHPGRPGRLREEDPRFHVARRDRADRGGGPRAGAVHRARLPLDPPGGRNRRGDRVPPGPARRIPARARAVLHPVPRAEVHGAGRVAGGGCRHLGRLLERLLPHLPPGNDGGGGDPPLEGEDAVLPGTGFVDPLPGRDRAGGGECPPETEDPEEGALRHRRRARGGAGPRSAHARRRDQGGGPVPLPGGASPRPGIPRYHRLGSRPPSRRPCRISPLPPPP